jgi:prophage DNA circulation protein
VTVSTLLRNVQGISNTTQGLTDVLGRLTGGSFWSQLRPASYRGVSFGVLGGSAQFGRRNAVHEYPFRDKPWVEDLGKAANRFQVSGFLVGDDVIAQRDRMVVAVTKPGDGELVHPTFGRLNVALLGFTVTEHWEHGRVFELTFSFMEQGQRQYPDSTTSASDAVGGGAAAADAAASANFVQRAVAALKSGVAVANEGAKTAAAWATTALQAGNDATSLLKLAVSLPGEFGRLLSAASGIGVGQVVATVAGLTVTNLVGKAPSRVRTSPHPRRQ